MAGYESTRRDFLKQVGLFATTTAIAATGLSQVGSLMADKKEEDTLTPDQEVFMLKYKNWLNEFHDMAQFQKVDALYPENNKKLVALSEEAKEWQDELIEHMKDENFARHYLLVTERVTTAI